MAYQPYYPQYQPYYPAPVQDPNMPRAPYNIPMPTAQQPSQGNIQPTMQTMGTPINQSINPMNQGISMVSRPVGNREEAMAAQIPFDNSINVFTDLSHDRVYIKTFNMNDGSSVFKTFVLDAPVPAEEPKQDVTAYASLDYAQSLGGEIEDLKNEITQLKNELWQMKKPALPMKKGAAKNDSDE